MDFFLGVQLHFTINLGNVFTFFGYLLDEVCFIKEKLDNKVSTEKT